MKRDTQQHECVARQVSAWTSSLVAAIHSRYCSKRATRLLFMHSATESATSLASHSHIDRGGQCCRINRRSCHLNQYPNVDATDVHTCYRECDRTQHARMQTISMHHACRLSSFQLIGSRFGRSTLQMAHCRSIDRSFPQFPDRSSWSHPAWYSAVSYLATLMAIFLTDALISLFLLSFSRLLVLLACQHVSDSSSGCRLSVFRIVSQCVRCILNLHSSIQPGKRTHTIQLCILLLLFLNPLSLSLSCDNNRVFLQRGMYLCFSLSLSLSVRA